MGIFTDVVAQWARCLASPDVEHPKSTAYRRIEALTSVTMRLIRLKVSSTRNCIPVSILGFLGVGF